MSQRSQIIWQPSGDDFHKSAMGRFLDTINQKYALSLQGYDQLHRWSVGRSTREKFWISVFKFLDIRTSRPPSEAIEKQNHMFPSPHFFPGTLMNFAENILSNRDPSATAIIEAQEGTLETTTITWGALQAHVESLVDSMTASGVRVGDRVVAVISNSELAIALSLATLSIGAIWSSISTDFGAQGIADRICQIDPVLIFAETKAAYNGKNRDLSQTIAAWAKDAALGSAFKNIIVTTIDDEGKKSVDANTITLKTFLSRGTGRKLIYKQLPFTQPAFIFFSSGTTGIPKCILHSAGGVLLQVKKDYTLHTGLTGNDILFQYTTTAWIMWTFMLTAMSLGTSIVVYTGSPLYPDLNMLPSLLSKLKVTVFGTSAKYLTDLMDNGLKLRNHFDLSALKIITSTGSVLPPDVACWIYNHGFPPHVRLVSGSGGTDCACSFVTGNPLLPLYSDQIQSKSIGMDVDVFDSSSSDGKSIESDEPGELVCKSPFPSQPLTFYGPDGDKKYREAYFSMFGDDVWVQGDLINISQETGGIHMLGRSDGVLNPSGVRFGSAEIYNVIRSFPDVEDSVCVGQRRPQDRDESVVLFLKLKPGCHKTRGLQQHICDRIGSTLSKKHVPRYVFYVNDIPYSGVGKKLEILVKNIISGREAKSTVVANPESLKLYRRYFDIEKASSIEKKKLGLSVL
ncbi:hypothetical protein VTL71DRAFT_6858 [Oculimacula yallundae]|uniref:AMP-dependent synthetase/ligase domain-containing protein n=1 Tax=Oculimacula yallundae TaxID=86028 RepID=A0ABR4BV38_9HELO